MKYAKYILALLLISSFITVVQGAATKTPTPTKAATDKLKLIQTSAAAKVAVPVSTKKATSTPSSVVNAMTCADVATLIDNEIKNTDNFNTAYTNNLNAYKDRKSTLENILATLDARGKDTTQMRTDVATFETKIENLTADKNAYLNYLNATKNLSCANSETGFKTAAGKAKNQKEVVRKDVGALYSFLTKTLMPELKAFRGRVPEATPLVSNSTSTKANVSSDVSSSVSATSTKKATTTNPR